MKFDRKIFFAEMRAAFRIRLRQGQVDGGESLLASMEADPELHDIRIAAYLLATAWHETAQTLQPICEYGLRSYFNRYDPVLTHFPARRARALRMGNTKEGDGYRYRGRGYVQMTWYNNYARATEELGIDFVGDPDQALDPVNAYLLLSRALMRGWYTGRKLSDYINAGWCNYIGARRTVNGTDRAALIAGYARNFEACLRAALLPDDAPVAEAQRPRRKRQEKEAAAA